jgi:uncharacterized Tic20 family protein
MTSYASHPTPEWPADGFAAGPPRREDEEPVSDRDWQTGPPAEWHTGPQGRWPDEPAQAQPAAAGRPGTAQPGTAQPGTAQPGAAQPGAAREHIPARELWASRLQDQVPRTSAFASPSSDGTAQVAADLTMRRDDSGQHGDLRAVLSYLGLPFLSFLPALAIYLITLRSSRFTRRHAAQALNLSITLILYNICALILAGLLALDTVSVAVLVTAPLLAVLWIVTLVYLVLAAIAASRGEFYQIPAWLCATLVR